ncbi:sulfite exporter TauE/SafE family protein [Streptomyces xiaopingdaonensis]|uniref:sulfite exporter TauE/SafE family protein n=1 Tax=Streptomyces xiaopingdaonensis TaxID=1565415 RepID=UPI0002FFF4E2|nr:sulfite exporter TauE/SafE family protein [Streptomyces xiaopingdaonensis]
MEWWEVLVISFAGLWAGTINTVVGSGTLVTFPVLVALGYPPVTATTSNAIGLVPGTIAGAWGYRHELGERSGSLRSLAVASFFGALGGSALLLTLPHDAFETVVPWLVGLSVALVAVQPLLTKWLGTRNTDAKPGPLLFFLIFLIGIYGGYFTAAQGIMLVGVMGLLMPDTVQRLNAVKNGLSAVVNLVAGAVYAVVAPVSWPVVGLLAVSSTCGGLLGARIGRKLPPLVLRIVIVVIGVAAVVHMVME